MCYLCGCRDYRKIVSYSKPDAYELANGIGNKGFFRRWVECAGCGLVYSLRSYRFDPAIYDKKYRSAEIQGAEMDNKFKEIVGLPYERSENKQRIKYLKELLVATAGRDWHSSGDNARKVLDIGYGTGVFLYEFLDRNWIGYGIDPDGSQSAALKKKSIKIKRGSFSKGIYKEKFDLITVIDVLEHIEDPVHFLKDIRSNMADDGYLFIEVPEASNISIHPKGHTLMASPHFYLFDYYTICLLLKKADLSLINLRCLVSVRGKVQLHLLVQKSGPTGHKKTGRRL